MFSNDLKQAFGKSGLGSFSVIKVEEQPGPAGPDAQKLFRQARIYKERGIELDNRAAIAHGNARRMALKREAMVAYNMAERFTEEAEALVHYGRKGMKWGLRRSKKQLRAADKAGVSKTKLQKVTKKMTDEDLQNNIKRLNLEKQYIKLNQEANQKTKTRMQRGKEEMASIARASTKTAVQKHTTNIITKTMTEVIKKKYPSYTLSTKKK